MQYTVTDKLMLAAIIMQFLIVVIAGTFSVHAVGVWLTNRREERGRIRDAEIDAQRRRSDRDRMQWAELLKDRENTIADQKVRRAVAERRLERLEDLLSASDTERRRLMQEATKCES